jgi:hypothetical protein
MWIGGGTFRSWVLLRARSRYVSSTSGPFFCGLVNSHILHIDYLIGRLGHGDSGYHHQISLKSTTVLYSKGDE